jgi:hypothetical protein
MNALQTQPFLNVPRDRLISKRVGRTPEGVPPNNGDSTLEMSDPQAIRPTALRVDGVT